MASSDFENSSDGLPRSPAAPILFERQDWAAFRTVEGLQQKAGVAKDRLAALVLKELADNGLDEGRKVRVGVHGGGYFVEDDGRGIDGNPDEIARLFSIARPALSTKLLRLPTRGALGNGLRVVAGAVLASQGSLTVITRNLRIELRPERDGTTTVVRARKVKFPVGTRIEIAFGPSLPHDESALARAQDAISMARGETYAGKSSPWWYDAAQFHELIAAGGDRPVRELIATLDGCTGSKAGEIVAAAALNRAICKDVTATQAAELLAAARQHTRPVNPARLGAAGPDVLPACGYGRASETVSFGTTEPFAEIPVVVEAWARKLNVDAEMELFAFVNRTRVTGNIDAARDKRDIDAFGCGLQHTIAKAPAALRFTIVINVIAPYIPITSDGKEPDFQPFLNAIRKAAQIAVRKVQRPTSGKRLSQKDIVLDNLDDAVAVVGGEERYRFNQRQLLYVLRKIVRDEIGATLTTANFNNIITDYENERDEIDGMYREPRGSIYHPHRRETIPLGTLMVEEYERPLWTFNKLVHIEKEGFSEALKAVDWGERHDCALTSTKGFTTRAIRDLVDKLAEHDEPVTVFLVTDADAYGTMIYQTFQKATKARGARKIKILHLGLHPWEAIADGLEVEDIEASEKRKPVADYVLQRDAEYPNEAPGEITWEEWLQTHRVELNAMTTPQFIAWLDGKMAEHGVGKLIPPDDVLEQELTERIENKVRAAITERILREAGLDDQVATAVARIRTPDGAKLARDTATLFKRQPDAEWRDHIEAVARQRTRSI